VLVYRFRADCGKTLGLGAAFLFLGAWLTCYRFMYYDVLLSMVGVACLFAEPWRLFRTRVFSLDFAHQSAETGTSMNPVASPAKPFGPRVVGYVNSFPLTLLGRALVFQNRFPEADSLLREALSVREHVYGPVHPAVASTLNELGVIAYRQDRYDDAEAWWSRMLSIYQTVYGDHHYLIAVATSNLANVYYGRKNYRRAELLNREAIRRFSETQGAGHLNTGVAHVKLGRTLLKEGRFADARVELLTGHDILIKLGKPDISMMLNGALGALVAITAASGFVAPWAAIVIGIGSGFIAVFGVIWVEKIGIDDPIGAVAVHGMSGVWGTLACGLFAVPILSANLATGHKGLVYGGGFHQLGVQALGLVAVGAFTFGTSFGCLWVLNKIWGIRVAPTAETDGLDVHEHGMWGYPEFYIPVPGGYGTESHGHLGTGAAHSHAPTPVHAMQARPVTSP
jgi:hypothetical protein